MSVADVTLQPWSDADLPLLEALLGDAAMMQHLGGPESLEQIHERHRRYLNLPETDHMFTIVVNHYERVGNVGYWEKSWHERQVYEMGWLVLAAYQGQGIATQAGQLVIRKARSDHRHQFMHAFPSVSNAASNAICRKLGFSLMEEAQVEYPPGNKLIVNDWRFDLFAAHVRSEHE